MPKLSQREKDRVNHLRVDLGWSLDRIGRYMGMTRSGVSRTLARATQKDTPGGAIERYTFRKRIRPIQLSLVKKHLI